MEVVRREHDDDVSRAALKGHWIQVESEQTRAARAKKAAVEDVISSRHVPRSKKK